MKFDFWYGNKLVDVKKISCSFSDVDSVYRGNMYDEGGKCIGDFETADSTEIEKTFNVSFE